MALDYKLFKTLEVDGVKMGIDPTIGEVLAVGNFFNIPASMTSWTDTISLDLEAKSLYLIQMSAVFAAASATGATWHNFGLKVNGSIVFRDTLLHTSNESQLRGASIGFKTGNSGVTLTLCGQGNRVMNGSEFNLWSYKLLSYPE